MRCFVSMLRTPTTLRILLWIIRLVHRLTRFHLVATGLMTERARLAHAVMGVALLEPLMGDAYLGLRFRFVHVQLMALLTSPLRVLMPVLRPCGQICLYLGCLSRMTPLWRVMSGCRSILRRSSALLSVLVSLGRGRYIALPVIVRAT